MPQREIVIFIMNTIDNYPLSPSISKFVHNLLLGVARGQLYGPWVIFIEKSGQPLRLISTLHDACISLNQMHYSYLLNNNMRQQEETIAHNKF
jgi:hypothetical protein